MARIKILINFDFWNSLLNFLVRKKFNSHANYFFKISKITKLAKKFRILLSFEEFFWFQNLKYHLDRNFILFIIQLKLYINKK